MVKKKKADAKMDAATSMSAKDVMAVMKKLNKDNDKYKAIELEAKRPGDFCSTGLLSLDLIMGGGYYGGQVFQCFGQSHAGKSSLGYTSAAWATSIAGIPTAFRDHEGTTDKAYTIKLGMDYNMVMYDRPESGENTYDWIDDFCRKLPDKHSGMPQAIIFIDTVKAMTPQKWIDDPTNKQPAIPASMHSRGWGRIQTLITNKHVAIVAANQVRSNVGNPYGAAEVVPGGNAWEFATTNLVRVGRGKGGNVELPDGRVMQPVKFKTYKNKNFIPMQECSVYLELGEGWDIASDVIEFCKLAGYFKRRKGDKIVQRGGLPMLIGLDTYVDGADIKAKSSAHLEETIREQGRDGVIFRACRKALTSGDAVALYRSSKKKDESDEDEDGALLATTRSKKDTIDDSHNPLEASTDDEDDTELPDASASASTQEAASEIETELPITLGKSQKKSAKKNTSKKETVRKKKTVAKKKVTTKQASA